MDQLRGALESELKKIKVKTDQKSNVALSTVQDEYCFAWMSPFEEYYKDLETIKCAIRREANHLVIKGHAIAPYKIKLDSIRVYRGQYQLEKGIKFKSNSNYVAECLEQLVVHGSSVIIARVEHLKPNTGQLVVSTRLNEKHTVLKTKEYWEHVETIENIANNSRFWGFQLPPTANKYVSNADGRQYNAQLCSDGSFLNLHSVLGMAQAFGIDTKSSLLPPSRIHDASIEYDEIRREQSITWARNQVEIGVAKARDGKYDSAIGNYDAALQFDPNHVDAFVARGAAYSNKSRYQMAIDDFNRALKLNPKHKNAELYLLTTKRKVEAQKIRSEEKRNESVSMKKVKSETAQGLEQDKIRRLLESEKKKKKRRKSSSSKERASKKHKKKKRKRSSSSSSAEGTAGHPILSRKSHRLWG